MISFGYILFIVMMIVNLDLLIMKNTQADDVCNFILFYKHALSLRFDVFNWTKTFDS